jgi:hypothetical protein
MILNTLIKKSALAVFIAFASIMWLNKWHEYVYSRGAVKFPPVSNWLRDSLIVLIPIMLAVWLGVALIEWLNTRLDERMSPIGKTILTAVILGTLTSLATILIEINRVIQTGISSEFSFVASICTRLYPSGTFILNILKSTFGGEGLRIHIMLQDGFNLALINLALIILLIIIMEALPKAKVFFEATAA